MSTSSDIYILLAVTIKTTLSSHKSPCPLCFQSLPFLSSIKCSRCHLGDLHKFCKNPPLCAAAHAQPLDNEDPHFKDFFWKALQDASVLACPSALYSLKTSNGVHVKCCMSSVKNKRCCMCVFWGRRRKQ